jgi:hypothetical protein
LGETVIDTNGAVTPRDDVEFTEPEAAIIVVLPTPTLVAKPLLLTVATAGAEEVQVTDDVRSLLLPSL